MPETAVDGERDIRARKYKVGLARQIVLKNTIFARQELSPRVWQVACLSEISQRLGRVSDNCDELFWPEPI